MDRTCPERAYQERADYFLAEQARLDRQSHRLAHLRLLLFVLFAALALATALSRLPRWGWAGAGLVLAAFVTVAVLHDRLIGREARARLAILLNQRGLERLRGELSSHPWNGELYAEPTHPYSADLDLFGPASLFQRLDTTGTAMGEAFLADWLQRPAPPEEIRDRQAHVRRLTPRIDERQALELEGRLRGTRKPDPRPLLHFCESIEPFEASPLERMGGILGPLLVLASGIAWGLGHSPLFFVGALALHALLLFKVRARLAPFFEALEQTGERLDAYAPILRAHEALDELPPEASHQLRSLARTASWLKLREQPLFHVPLNLLTLFDLHLGQRLGRWQGRHRGDLPLWFERLARTEALASFAAFAFENPEAVFPELIDPGPASHLEATGLGHPLIPPARRICNDVALGTLVVTGSNMAGKTTFLRTIGLGAVLAQAGAPVCARTFRLTPLAVATSMRVRDSLSEGVSLFYAELKRLKQVVDRCHQTPTLFLLDEILQGTNTAERQQASQAILRQLVDLGAIGAVATHDLALTRLTDDRIANVHFTDRLQGDEILFDYRICPGVVTTTNALALIRKIGIAL